ncbi:MAG TPA: hypothetical protein VK173_08700 [Lacibacter sp.]|nr:hypothetical protein [Lacibacter sp.]
MINNDFYPGMKVSLNGQYGVVINEFKIINEASKEFGIIRWDTEKAFDLEDWVGLFGTFKDHGGREVSSKHQFRFINDDGSFRLE